MFLVKKILIEAKTAKGAYYGIQTLMQILKQVSTRNSLLKNNRLSLLIKSEGYTMIFHSQAMVPKIEELFTIVGASQAFQD